MRQVMQARQRAWRLDGKARAGRGAVGVGQPQHHVHVHRLQGQVAVDRDDLQAHAGVAAQQGDQVATKDVVQDRLGHRQADQRLLHHRQAPFMGQRNQLRLQLQAVATEHQAVALVGEQRMAHLFFQLRQALAQQRRFDIQAARRLHETATARTHQKVARHLRVDLAGQSRPTAARLARRAISGGRLGAGRF